MGKPKFSRKKYETPSHPWQEARIRGENELVKKFGLKNKREIWKAETTLRKYRGQARELLAKVSSDDPQFRKESDQLLMHLTRMNILPPNSTLDDVLALETSSILSRRLQTLTYLKGLASTPTQARQLIAHGHIAIGDRKITISSYMVTKEEEGSIKYIDDSPLNDALHPARPKADFRSAPIKREAKPEAEKPKESEKTETKVESQDQKPVDKKVEETPLDKKPESKEDSVKLPEKEKVQDKQEEPISKPELKIEDESEDVKVEKTIDETQTEEQPVVVEKTIDEKVEETPLDKKPESKEDSVKLPEKEKVEDKQENKMKTDDEKKDVKKKPEEKKEDGGN